MGDMDVEYFQKKNFNEDLFILWGNSFNHRFGLSAARLWDF